MRDLLKFGSGALTRAVFGAAFLTAVAPGAASAGDRVGALQCRLSGSSLGILVENQTLDCLFEDDNEGAHPAHYVGTLTKVGANVTINGPGEIVWIVGAATGHVGPGALTGSYAGPEAGAKIGVGGSGAILVGGNGNTISLQPFEVEAGSGLGFTAGIENLTLTYVPDAPPPVFRRSHRVIRKG